MNFATILVPGLMASMLLMQGIMAVTFPLVMEFSWQRTIEDRALVLTHHETPIDLPRRGRRVPLAPFGWPDDPPR